MEYMGKKLTKFEKRISLDVATQYFADLTGEEMDIDTMERLAFGRIPLYCVLRQTGGVSFIVGFFETNVEELLSRLEPGEDADESMSRAFISSGGALEYQFVEHELPFPITSPLLGLDTSSTPTKNGDIYWFMFSPNSRQLVPFSSYDVDAITITVCPKDVYRLAMQANSDEDWPENHEGLCSKQLIRNNAASHKEPEVEISGIYIRPGTSFYGLHEASDAPEGEVELVDVEQGASAYLAISGMIKMITGISNKNQASIQDFIYEEFGGARGTSQSKLQKLFAKANAAAEEARKG